MIMKISITIIIKIHNVIDKMMNRFFNRVRARIIQLQVTLNCNNKLLTKINNKENYLNNTVKIQIL